MGLFDMFKSGKEIRFSAEEIAEKLEKIVFETSFVHAVKLNQTFAGISDEDFWKIVYLFEALNFHLIDRVAFGYLGNSPQRNQFVDAMYAHLANTTVRVKNEIAFEKLSVKTNVNVIKLFENSHLNFKASELDDDIKRFFTFITGTQMEFAKYKEISAAENALESGTLLFEFTKIMIKETGREKDLIFMAAVRSFASSQTAIVDLAENAFRFVKK